MPPTYCDEREIIKRIQETHISFTVVRSQCNQFSIIGGGVFLTHFLNFSLLHIIERKVPRANR